MNERLCLCEMSQIEESCGQWFDVFGGDGPLTFVVFWDWGSERAHLCMCLFQLIGSSVCKKLVMLCLRALLLTARRDQLFTVISLN